MWQEGFAAFTYSYSQLKDVITYIENQETHHSNKTFKEEYLELLKRFNVPYNPNMSLVRTIRPDNDSHVAPLGLKDRGREATPTEETGAASYALFSVCLNRGLECEKQPPKSRSR